VSSLSTMLDGSNWESLNITNLREDDHPEDESNSWKRLNEMQGLNPAEQRCHPLLKSLQLPLKMIKLFDECLGRVARLRRQLVEEVVQYPSTSNAKQIRDPAGLQTVLRQGGMNAVLRLCPLSDEHHPCPRQLTCVSQFSRWNPHRQQSS